MIYQKILPVNEAHIRPIFGIYSVAFMALLILIKSITNKYDSPNVAYYCGNAYPWYYEDGTSLNASNVLTSPLVQCLEKPTECTTENYYKSGITLSDGEDEGSEGVNLYSQYGYVDSSASDGASTNPYYSKFEYWRENLFHFL